MCAVHEEFGICKHFCNERSYFIFRIQKHLRHTCKNDLSTRCLDGNTVILEVCLRVLPHLSGIIDGSNICSPAAVHFFTYRCFESHHSALKDNHFVSLSQHKYTKSMQWGVEDSITIYSHHTREKSYTSFKIVKLKKKIKTSVWVLDQ